MPEYIYGIVVDLIKHVLPIITSFKYLKTFISLFWNTKVLEKYYGGGFVGVDKEGCPVRIEPFGRRDIKGKKSVCYSFTRRLFEILASTYGPGPNASGPYMVMDH